MKKGWIWTLVLMLVVAAPFALAAENPTIDLLLSGYAAKDFTDKAVSDADLEQILAAGAQAPSALNLQPWRFTVVQNAETAASLVGDSTAGTVLIIISGPAEAQRGQDVSFDCGLATQNMVVAAQALELGSHIYGSPIGTIAGQREALGIPEGFNPVMALLVGHVGTDAVSSASPRNALADTVNYVK